MTQPTAMAELVKNLRKLDNASAPMTLGEWIAPELTGRPLADRILLETWRAFVVTQVKAGALKADLPASETSLVYGLTDHGRDVIAKYEQLCSNAGR